jgi:hypothetical protein
VAHGVRPTRREPRGTERRCPLAVPEPLEVYVTTAGRREQDPRVFIFTGTPTGRPNTVTEPRRTNRDPVPGRSDLNR